MAEPTLAYRDPHQRGIIWFHGFGGQTGAWHPVVFHRTGNVGLGEFRDVEAALKALHAAMDFPTDIALPAGWTWAMVREHRAKWGTGVEMVPVASAPGCVAWGHVNFERSHGKPPVRAMEAA